MSLNSADVCAIIKACGEAGVTKLKFDGLDLSLGKPPSEPRPQDQSTDPTGPASTPIPVATLTESEHTKLSKEALEEAELIMRESQIEELKITDPAKYEELMVNGELENERDGNEDSFA